MQNYSFPANFIWGTATSSYQIEGAAKADGRSESIWDRFSHTPGKIVDGTNGDVACEHYDRMREDVALMQQLGIRAYRFSIAWPRILPEGRGAVNEAGLAFYSRLVDELLAHGIQPWATLYHWDLPQVLQDEGGWAVRSTAEAFVQFADVVSQRLGDRVKHWITHNEPWCVSFLSYQIGEHAPGLRDWSLAIAASHHVLLSHGWAVPVIRRNVPDAQVGITLNFTPAYPASASAADQERWRWTDGYAHRWFLDPLYGRHYPADMVVDYIAAGHLPAEGLTMVQPGDLAAIATQTDFLGINFYTRQVVRDTKASDNLPQTVIAAGPERRTDIGWEIYPEALYELLVRLHFEYRPGPMYITENGASYSDAPDSTGQIYDERRLDYLYNHFSAMHRAISVGVPLAGYFIWSFLDNFEWAFGYSQRFGVVWVDFETQQRIPKASALWYKHVINQNALVVPDVARPEPNSAALNPSVLLTK